MKRLFRLSMRLLLFVLLGILGLMVIKTLSNSSRQMDVVPAETVQVPDEAVIRLQQAVRYPTVSFPDRIDTAAFIGLDTFLSRAFPMVDSLLDHRRINRYSHVYRWPGRKAGLEPILLMGHLDVVPVEGDALRKWARPPFSGEAADGYVWGRGTLDDKSACMGLLEAVDLLLREGFSPERTIYLAFGHDEEVGGQQGAAAIAEKMEKDGIRLAYVLDEGLVVVKEALPGLAAPFAGVGIAEKGYVTLELEVDLNEGGHSSMPPRETAVGILGRAIDRLQTRPLPASFDGPTGDMLAYLGPEMSFPFRAVFSNLWLTESLLEGQFRNDPAANAMIRTTTAPTMIEGGVKANVLPTSAKAKVNFRILPGETVESTLQQVEQTVDDDRVLVRVDEKDDHQNPSPVSNPDGFGFNIIQKSVREIFPEAVVAPSLVIAMTDSRHYQRVSDEVFRFFPAELSKADLKRIHGIDERIGIADYKRAIRFYRQLMLNSSR